MCFEFSVRAVKGLRASPAEIVMLPRRSLLRKSDLGWRLISNKYRVTESELTMILKTPAPGSVDCSGAGVPPTDTDLRETPTAEHLHWRWIVEWTVQETVPRQSPQAPTPRGLIRR